MSDKEIIDGANTLALQYFTTYNRMLQLTGNSEEAIRLTSSLFEAMFAGNRPRPEPGAGGFTLYWDRRETMTKEQFDKATELNQEIQKYTDLIIKIKDGRYTKIKMDKAAKEDLGKRSDDHDARWQLLRFFQLRLEKQKVIVMPHYEFARGIEMDAEPELIAVIIDYLEKKKKTYEAEFEKIGGEDRDREENAAD